MKDEARHDVVIVGGGIVGAGIARDAAMRGLRVLLVEQYDFAFGTSSRSSRLLHGGLRYLTQGKLGMVLQASREKAILTRIAPHLSKPLPFLFPTRRHTPWTKWKLHLGVKLYDLMTGDQSFAASRGLKRDEVLRLLPGLDPTDLSGAVLYYDALTNDARLVLDTLHSAVRHGAEIANYTRFAGANREGEEWVCNLQDSTSGKRSVRAVCIVNATGPWGDRLVHSAVRLRPTKGIHLVINHERLPIEEAVVLTEERRILFLLPWGKRLIIGTTDTDYAGPVETPRATAEDIAYILKVVNQALPGIGLTAGDVRATWAGLRPLVADSKGHPSDISRGHEITQPHPGWWDVTGGKLTTYRAMAQGAVDQICRQHDFAALPCRTAREPLVESADFSGVLPPDLERAPVAYYCRHEWVRHLDDIMVRRSSWHYYLEEPAEAARQVARWMAQELDWTPTRIEQEIARYQRMTAPMH